VISYSSVKIRKEGFEKSTLSYLSLVHGIGMCFIGGLLLGYAVKKSQVIAVVVGLFIAGLAYLQYQQIPSFDWNRIEGTISTIANATTSTLNNYNIETLATTNFGVPLASGMSAGFAIGFMKG
jgi:uncharacterized membrane protein (Fun14 family)